MKNKLLIAFLCVSFLATIAKSQNNLDSLSSYKPFKNKRGVIITPEKGDFAIGIDATPFFEYIGNMFRIAENPNQAPSFGFTAQNPGMIYGKYMLSNTKAITAAFRIGFTNTVDKEGDGTNTDDVDKYISSAANIGLSIGMEYSPLMKSRIRGFWGYAGGINISPYQGYSYTDPNIMVIGKYKYKQSNSPSGEFVEKGGNIYSFGIQTKVGVEYFIFPKLSLSGQFNLMFAYQMQTARKYVPYSGDEVVIDAGMNRFAIDNIASGSITAMFYF